MHNEFYALSFSALKPYAFYAFNLTWITIKVLTNFFNCNYSLTKGEIFNLLIFSIHCLPVPGRILNY